MDARSFNASLLFEPRTVQNKSGGPFQVFTPFWRHCLTLPVDEPVKLPRGDFPAPAAWSATAAGSLPASRAARKRQRHSSSVRA